MLPVPVEPKNKNSRIVGSESESESDKEDGDKLIGKMFVRPVVSWFLLKNPSQKKICKQIMHLNEWMNDLTICEWGLRFLKIGLNLNYLKTNYYLQDNPLNKPITTTTTTTAATIASSNNSPTHKINWNNVSLDATTESSHNVNIFN